MHGIFEEFLKNKCTIEVIEKSDNPATINCMRLKKLGIKSTMNKLI